MLGLDHEQVTPGIGKGSKCTAFGIVLVGGGIGSIQLIFWLAEHLSRACLIGVIGIGIWLLAVAMCYFRG